MVVKHKMKLTEVFASAIFSNLLGGVSEWLKEAVLKTVVP